VFRLGVDGIEKRDADTCCLDDDDERIGFRLGYGRRIGFADFGSRSRWNPYAGFVQGDFIPGLDLAASKSIAAPFRHSKHHAICCRPECHRPSMRLVDDAVKARSRFRPDSAPGQWFAIVATTPLNSTVVSPSRNWRHPHCCRSRVLDVDMLSLRAGLCDEQWSFGAGYRSGVSVSTTHCHRDLGAVHMITLTSAFVHQLPSVARTAPDVRRSIQPGDERAIDQEEH